MSRRALLVICAALAIVATQAVVARADVCDHVPSIGIGPVSTTTPCKVVEHPLKSAKGVANAVTHPADTAKNIVTAPFKAAGDEVMQGITTWVADGAGWLVEQGGKLIDATTTPRIESPWFLRQYGLMSAVATLFALPLLLFAVIQGVLQRDAGTIMRAAAFNLPLAFIFSAMAVVVVALCLSLTDWMSAQVAQSVGSDARAFFADTTKALASVGGAAGGPQGAVVVPLFAQFLGALVAAIGAFLVWLELLLRSAAIYVTVLFLPLGFVGMIWPSTARWTRVLAWLLFAIIFTKFVIVAILALASAGLSHSGSRESFQGVLAGGALLILAATSPFALLKLVPFVEGAVDRYGARRAAGTAVMPMSPSMMMAQVLTTNWSAGRVATATAGAAGGGAGAGVVAAGRASGAGRGAEEGAAGGRGGGAGDRGRGGGEAAAPRPSGESAGGATRAGGERPGASTQASSEGRRPESPGGVSDPPRPASGPAPREPAGQDPARDRYRGKGGDGHGR